jgi:uncharacterized protein YjbJ (UPF0337 family)
MITREQVTGNWNQLKGKIKEHWGQLTDNELDQAKGNVDQLIGVIQNKTGKARGEIERFLDEISSGAGGAINQATERAREYANQAVERGREYASQAADRGREYASQAGEMMRERYGEAQDMVRRHPAESVAVAFGTGLVIGAIVGLMCRTR